MRGVQKKNPRVPTLVADQERGVSAFLRKLVSQRVRSATPSQCVNLERRRREDYLKSVLT